MSTKAERKKQAAVFETLREDIDRYFPQNGPCGFCGDTVIGQRHRIIDAIAGMVRGGDDPHTIADDYDLPLIAVVYALAVSW